MNNDESKTDLTDKRQYCKYCHWNTPDVPLIDGGHKYCREIMEGTSKCENITASITLGYWKQGDDLQQNIVKNSKGNNDVVASFEGHATQLESVVTHLREIADLLQSFKEKEPNLDALIEIYADTHHISLYGPKNILLELIKQGKAGLDFHHEEWYEDDVDF
ncbi:MAG: hypothetical protein ACXAD7_23140 [Candidatus Kariarchaeaceae archaeon]|jgi:hypothetical protein